MPIINTSTEENSELRYGAAPKLLVFGPIAELGDNSPLSRRINVLTAGGKIRHNLGQPEMPLEQSDKKKHPVTNYGQNLTLGGDSLVNTARLLSHTLFGCSSGISGWPKLWGVAIYSRRITRADVEVTGVGGGAWSVPQIRSRTSEIYGEGFPGKAREDEFGFLCSEGPSRR
ncbi:hypothetical protein B9Z19DRAFT_1132540 [Tuber borchii]|uniref:Uncharacterized protein n=1 Tax=Tuber borchii TaxID=42251 RepID=A0A2T6ZH49_TUBBO|nr:hypothetical protein B9Z19DRAFT_1132540 [Tuber borchii]